MMRAAELAERFDVTTRTIERDLLARREAGVPIWGTIPERVAIAAGPDAWLSDDGLDAYRGVWRRAQRATR